MDDKVKILLVDDHALIRDGIKATLNSEDNWNVIGEASSAEEAINIIPELNPDVVIMDISLPKMNGMEAAKAIIEQYTEVKVIMLSMYFEEEYISKSLEYGASGYIVKSAGGVEVSKAIKAVMQGQKYFSDRVQDVIMQSYLSSKSKAPNREESEVVLTEREKEIVKFVVKGYTSQQIAEQLFISPRTVDTHRSNIMKKMDVKNSAELVNKALKLNLT